MKKNILAFHGSPGHPDDFLHLKREMNDDVIFTLANRDNLNDEDNFDAIMGYSFGCVLALESALKNKSSKVILISPYIYPQSKLSLIKKIVLKTPGIGALILGLVGQKEIDKMLTQSSHPAQVPESYKQDALNYNIPYRLRQSIFEKDIETSYIDQLLLKHKELGTKITIIRGREDTTSDYQEQISPLIEKSSASEEILEMAGHALLWTHIDELSDKIKQIISIAPTKKKISEKSHHLGYFPGENINNNVSAFLTQHLHKKPMQQILSWVHPEKIATWNGVDSLQHDSVKVAELDHLVSVLATGLKNLGLQKGDRVIIFIPMSLYMYAAMFAVQRLGAIAVFLDSWARRDQMGKSAEVVAPRMIISVEKAFQYLADVKEIQDIKLKVVAGPHTGQYNASLDQLFKETERTEPAPVEKEHTALITFTTGSSGTPKGADRGHRFLAAQHYALNRHLPYNDKDVDLPVFPIFSLNNLAAGVKTVLPAIDVGIPNEKDPLILYHQMLSEGVTCTTLSPSLFNALSNWCIQNKKELSFLRRIITGGAPVSNDDVKKMLQVAKQAEILVLYGSTEVEPMAHIEARQMLNQKKSSDPEIELEGGNDGKMDSGLKVKYLKINKDPIFIKNDSEWKTHEVTKGEVGEIIVAGEHVCQGYWNNEEAFYRAKIRDHENTVWHRTGDLGRIDSESNLWLVGRVHNAISRKGKYYFPVRAEVIMKKLSFVKKCAYLGIEDKELGEKTIAAYMTSDDALGSPAEWEDEIKRILAKNDVVVDRVVRVEDIPMDPRHHSKVEYTILRSSILEKGL